MATHFEKGRPKLREKFQVAVLNGSNHHREVSEAIHFGLLDAGYDSILTGIYQFQKYPERRKIVFCVRLGKTLRERFPGTDWRELLAEDDIFYNSEQLRDSLMQDYELDEIVRERVVWDYSVNNLMFLTDRGCRKAVFVPLGYTKKLRRIPRQKCDADVMFYGLVNARRASVLEGLRDAGLRCRVHDGSNPVWGSERDSLIAQSKIILNIHFYEYRIFEVFRAFYPLLNEKCLVSETGLDANEDVYKSAAVFCRYDELVETCVHYANDKKLRRSQEKQAARAMRLLRQSEILERSLESS